MTLKSILSGAAILIVIFLIPAFEGLVNFVMAAL